MNTPPPLDLPPDASRQLAGAWSRPLLVTESTSVPAGPAGAGRRRFWRKRRFWGAALAVGAAGVAAGIAYHRSCQTRVIFINAGESTVAGLSVAAGGETHNVPALENGQSHRWVMSAAGQSSVIALRGLRLDGSEWSWEGSYLTPGDGQRLVLRLTSEGMVEYGESLSLWRTFAGD